MGRAWLTANEVSIAGRAQKGQVLGMLLHHPSQGGHSSHRLCPGSIPVVALDFGTLPCPSLKSRVLVPVDAAASKSWSFVGCKKRRDLGFSPVQTAPKQVPSAVTAGTRLSHEIWKHFQENSSHGRQGTALAEQIQRALQCSRR